MRMFKSAAKRVASARSSTAVAKSVITLAANAIQHLKISKEVEEIVEMVEVEEMVQKGEEEMKKIRV